MQCPSCHAMESRVADSRLVGSGTCVWRRRVCDGCKRRFTTYERVEYTLPTVVKKDGHREPFKREKLLRGLEIACNKRPVSADQMDAIANGVERWLAERGEKEIPSREIGGQVMAGLKELDEVAYVRFASVYKSFRDIDEFMREMGDLMLAKPGTQGEHV